MSHRRLSLVLAAALVWTAWATRPAPAQPAAPQAYQLQRFYYYPYYYFPHNYWPLMGPKWPERPNMPYLRPPAYMAYPPFLEANWRYELWQPQRYYQGSHFWLDQF
jgi:hypothetical protein